MTEVATTKQGKGAAEERVLIALSRGKSCIVGQSGMGERGRQRRPQSHWKDQQWHHDQRAHKDQEENKNP